jgi:YidC/Oxa1 family membrane protein insertase
MQRRTLIAIAVIALLLILQNFLMHALGLDRAKNAPPPALRDTSSIAIIDTSGPAPAPVASSLSAGGSPRPQLSAGFFSATEALARTYVLENDLYRAEFESHGARLVRVELKRFRSAHGASVGNPHGREIAAGDRVVLAGGPTLALDLGAGPTLRSLSSAVFAVAESADASGRVTALIFTARDSSGATLREVYRMRPGSYGLDLEVTIQNVPLEWRLSDYTLTLRSWPLVTESNQVEDERALQSVALVGSDVRRDRAAGQRDKTKSHTGNVAWAGVQTRYFTAVAGIESAVGKEAVASAWLRELSPAERATLGANAPTQQLVAESRLVVGLPGQTQPTNRFMIYAGPKDYFVLQKLGAQLERGVDLGWSWVVPFSKLLLQLLTFLHRVVPNYGVAIILLATLVRLLLHPLNISSMKSMRAMQRLQPEVERLRAKYKDNPQAMNTAMMTLYKENKVNPAGGCLPLLLQMPIFFALYSVLFHAIELRQAPFVLWVNDLSAPDHLLSIGPLPIRLLPILMAGSGILQQRLTPTDPRQVNTMYLMNVFMVVFFYNLPSGLVLYWTVMNLLTALQQWLLLREDGGSAPAAATTTPAVAKKRGGK